MLRVKATSTLRIRCSRRLSEGAIRKIDTKHEVEWIRRAHGRCGPTGAIHDGHPLYEKLLLWQDSDHDGVSEAHEIERFLAAAEAQESFVRTFAYASGPAYGLLLDASSPGWTRRVRGTDDLATLVMRALAVQPATDATASAARYGGAEIRASEQQREQERQERVAELRRRFVDGPVLVIPGGGSTLEAEKGVLVASDGGSRRVAAPVRRDDVTCAGDGWTFTAAPGWVVREGTRRGEYEVVREQP